LRSFIIICVLVIMILLDRFFDLNQFID